MCFMCKAREKGSSARLNFNAGIIPLTRLELRLLYKEGKKEQQKAKTLSLENNFYLKLVVVVGVVVDGFLP